MHEIPQQTGRVTELIYTYHTIALAAGFILDLIFGDPRWLYHPVCLIGKLISSFEKGIRKVFPKTEKGELAGGLVEVILICVITLLVPAFVLYFLYIHLPALGVLLETFWCYQLLATRSLRDESMKVYDALKKGTIEDARHAVSMIVGRDTAELTEEGVTKAAVETVAENTSDGVIAPGYTEEALEILKQKKKGNYNVIQIDPEYVPAPLEHKQVFGVTFEQGRQELAIDDELISNIVTENKELSEEAKRDMKVSLIILKYTQSNSVCYVKDGQAIGVGAGQQSRVHCTRLAGQKADNWFLRQSPKVLNLPFKDTISRAERDNAIDVYIGEEYMDVLADGAWENVFTEKPEVFTREEKRAWLDQLTDVTLGSDAFFPFSDNIERAHKSGVKFIAQPGGSVRDDAVIETCNKYGIVMAFTGIRLFHH